MSNPSHTVCTYTPYGFSRPSVVRWGFNGAFRDPFTNQYPLGNGHRMYNPTLMRFQSLDSLSPFSKGGLNCYTYCEGDPVDYQDPLGRNRLSALLRSRTVKKALSAMAGAYGYDKRELIAEFGQTIKHTIIPGELTMKDASPARQWIDMNTAQSHRMFNRGLQVSNRVLASNGNGSVGYRQAQTYTADSAQDWSDTFKFARSTYRWIVKTIKYKRPDAAAGALLNGSSTVLASSHDHAMYKTGKLFTDAYAIRQ